MIDHGNLKLGKYLQSQVGCVTRITVAKRSYSNESPEMADWFVKINKLIPTLIRIPHFNGPTVLELSPNNI